MVGLAPLHLFVSVVAAFHMQPLVRPRSVSPRSRAITSTAIGVKHLIRDLEHLGPCRFVVSGRGAILEAIGVFEGLRESKAGLVTVSNDDNSFECHVRLDEVKSAQFAKKEAATGRLMHIVRLLGEDKTPLLSAILHPEEGEEVDEGAIEFWDNLRKRFGDDVDLVRDE